MKLAVRVVKALPVVLKKAGVPAFETAASRGRDGLRDESLDFGRRQVAREQRVGRRAGVGRAGRRHRAEVVRRAAARAAHAEAHAVARLPLVSHAHQHVAHVRHLVAQADDEGGEPRLVRHGRDALDLELVNLVRGVLGVGRDGGGRLARLQLQIHGEEDDARAAV
jgi:hypothetical protein